MTKMQVWRIAGCAALALVPAACSSASLSSPAQHGASGRHSRHPSSGLSPARPYLATRIELRRTSVPAGTDISGTIVVVNSSAKTINLTTESTPQFGVAITNSRIPSQLAWGAPVRLRPS